MTFPNQQDFSGKANGAGWEKFRRPQRVALPGSLPGWVKCEPQEQLVTGLGSETATTQAVKTNNDHLKMINKKNTESGEVDQMVTNSTKKVLQVPQDIRNRALLCKGGSSCNQKEDTLTEQDLERNDGSSNSSDAEASGQETLKEGDNLAEGSPMEHGLPDQVTPSTAASGGSIGSGDGLAEGQCSDSETSPKPEGIPSGSQQEGDSIEEPSSSTETAGLSASQPAIQGADSPCIHEDASAANIGSGDGLADGHSPDGETSRKPEGIDPGSQQEGEGMEEPISSAETQGLSASQPAIQGTDPPCIQDDAYVLPAASPPASSRFTRFQDMRETPDFTSPANLWSIYGIEILKKPPQDRFARIHPDKSYSFKASVLEIKDNPCHEGLYFLNLLACPELEYILEELGRWKPRLLFLAQDSQGEYFLWSFPTKDFNNSYNRTALKGMAAAYNQWVKMVTHKPTKTYKVITCKSEEAMPSLIWPEVSMQKILREAFDGAVIDSLDHPVMKFLTGS